MGFWDDFTGKSARDDIAAGKKKANAALNTGEQAAYGHYDEGIETLDPYSDPAAYEAWKASMGLSGDPARQAVQDTYMNDPIQNALMDRITRANTRRFTGIGQGNSGAATQSLTNNLLDNWRTYQTQLKEGGQMGAQAATSQAGIQTGKGDIAFTGGQQRAGIETSAASAMANTRGTLMNNLISIGSLGVNALTGMRSPTGRTGYAGTAGKMGAY